jgi:hypothetical protein
LEEAMETSPFHFSCQAADSRIDFSTQMIIAVFSGYSGSNTRISIQRITKDDDHFRIDVIRTIRTGPHCDPIDGAVHEPFQIVVLEKVSKPARKHPEFFLETVRQDCGTQ